MRTIIGNIFTSSAIIIFGCKCSISYVPYSYMQQKLDSRKIANSDFDLPLFFCSRGSHLAQS